MTDENRISRRSALTAVAVATCATGMIAVTPEAVAKDNTCPADKKLSKPRDVGNIAEKLLKRQTLSEVDLKGWRGLGDLFLRMRRLTIEPGGFVPTHYHDDRPSIVFVVQGELTEHNTFCSDPIVYRAGDWSAEFGPFVGHWWENTGKETAVVLSADVIPPEYRDMMDKDM